MGGKRLSVNETACVAGVSRAALYRHLTPDGERRGDAPSVPA